MVSMLAKSFPEEWMSACVTWLEHQKLTPPRKPAHVPLVRQQPSARVQVQVVLIIYVAVSYRTVMWQYGVIPICHLLLLCPNFEREG